MPGQLCYMLTVYLNLIKIKLTTQVFQINQKLKFTGKDESVKIVIVREIVSLFQTAGIEVTNTVLDLIHTSLKTRNPGPMNESWSTERKDINLGLIKMNHIKS